MRTSSCSVRPTCSQKESGLQISSISQAIHHAASLGRRFCGHAARSVACLPASQLAGYWKPMVVFSVSRILTLQSERVGFRYLPSLSAPPSDDGVLAGLRTRPTRRSLLHVTNWRSFQVIMVHRPRRRMCDQSSSGLTVGSCLTENNRFQGDKRTMDTSP